MIEETSMLVKRVESKIFDLSVRAWIALIVILTYAILAVMGKIPVDMVKDVTLVVLTAYFTVNALHKESK